MGANGERRVTLVITDGVRPDAINPWTTPRLYTLGHDYTRAVNMHTIRPSATVAALTSLATGVSPARHRLLEPGLDFLSRLRGVRPVGSLLRRMNLDTAVVMQDVNPITRGVARAILAAAGVDRVVSGGNGASAIGATAREVRRHFALTVVYLPDCDEVGHREGWMSPPYMEKTREIDRAIGELIPLGPEELLVVVSDHGGGGVTERDHDEPHPLNDHIPLLLAGRHVRRRHVIALKTSILDVPPTLLRWLGCEIPDYFEGSPLDSAFIDDEVLGSVVC
jgi:predicted AlkP superfamily pyrophosphatase or phosphodiesterase